MVESMGEVFVVEDEEEVVEKKIEVLKKAFVFFGRGWWQSSNRGCRRSLLRNIHSSRSGSQSRRVRAFDTLFYGDGAFGLGVFLVSWFFHLLRRAECLL